MAEFGQPPMVAPPPIDMAPRGAMAGMQDMVSQRHIPWQQRLVQVGHDLLQIARDASGDGNKDATIAIADFVDKIPDIAGAGQQGPTGPGMGGGMASPGGTMPPQTPMGPPLPRPGLGGGPAGPFG